jgi:hypothetical protein
VEPYPCPDFTEQPSAARGFKNSDNYAARIKLHAGQPRRLPTTSRIRSYSFATAA